MLVPQPLPSGAASGLPVRVTVKLGAVVIPQFARVPVPAGVSVATRVKLSFAQLPLPPESGRALSRVVAVTSGLRLSRWLLTAAVAGMTPARPMPAAAPATRATWITRAFMIVLPFRLWSSRRDAGGEAAGVSSCDGRACPSMPRPRLRSRPGRSGQDYGV